MRICYVQPYCPPNADLAPADYLDRFPLLRHLPRQVARLGHHVDVVVQHPHATHYREHGVRYHLVSEGHVAATLGRGLARLSPIAAAHLIPARSTVARVVDLKPDLVHVHGLVPHINLALVDRALRRCGTPWVAQHHGGEPARSWLVRRLQRRWLTGPATLLFTAPEHAQPYVDAGLLEDGYERVAQVVETSSALNPQDREAARQRTGFDGAPVLLSVARLHPVKDPLTMLRGVEAIVDALPTARLHCVYQSADLLDEVSDFLRSRPRLACRTTLHGEAPAAEMEAIYSSADFLLQASLREHSGCAVLEAMSCGVVPVVTDIPAFREMLGAELGGLLFPVGDAAALARRVQSIWAERPAEVAQCVVDRFDRRLSFAAMAERLAALYERVVQRREAGDNVA